MRIEATFNRLASSTAQSHRIHEAAEKFEAVLLGEMLKPLAQKGDDAEKDGSVLQGYGVEALAQTLAHHGGLGFAKLMEHRFENRGENISSQG